jgi:serine/threonine-protein kinase
MGSIYLADDLRLEGRLCALKEVEHDRSLSVDLLREAREQFLREATVLARLDHPNLPKVSDFFSIGNRDYLVMDYVPGKDLRTLMLEARNAGTFLSESDVLSWSDQLADALAFLHNQDPPILHRDIKPSNLKLTPSGMVKLVDFGLVKLLAPGEVTITVLQGQGTALYTPLEQYGGDSGHTDVRSDIYARDRFLDPERFIPPRQINMGVSARTEKAILWGMELHPDDRPKSVEIFRQSLLGSYQPIVRPLTRPGSSITHYIYTDPERLLILIGTALAILSLIATLAP